MDTSGAGKTPKNRAVRRSTQRERLTRSMVDVAARLGYAQATIAKVIAQAGVSRPTFYDYFSDRDACVVASSREVGDELAAHIAAFTSCSPPEQALQATLEAHVDFAAQRPSEASFLFSETLAGGTRTLDERDRIIGEIAQVIENAYRELPADTLVPDLSSRLVLGGVWRLLSTRLRQDEPSLSGFSDALISWIARYREPLQSHRWRSLRPVPTQPTATQFPIVAPLRPPGTPAPGRPRMSREEVKENRRRRILAATVAAAKQHGYSATTVAEITRLASVDSRVFNSLFAGKREAFLAAHELGVQSTMAATASAFFVEASWPERVWAAGQAFAGYLEANPEIAHMGFVEAYAVGPDAVQRVEDSRSGFTIFLQEGYQACPQEQAPSRDELEAIAAATFELAYRLTRERDHHGLTGLLAHIIHLALTPFMGSAAANRFVAMKLDEEHPPHD